MWACAHPSPPIVPEYLSIYLRLLSFFCITVQIHILSIYLLTFSLIYFCVVLISRPFLRSFYFGWVNLCCVCVCLGLCVWYFSFSAWSAAHSPLEIKGPEQSGVYSRTGSAVAVRQVHSTCVSDCLKVNDCMPSFPSYCLTTLFIFHLYVRFSVICCFDEWISAFKIFKMTLNEFPELEIVWELHKANRESVLVLIIAVQHTKKQARIPFPTLNVNCISFCLAPSSKKSPPHQCHCCCSSCGRFSETYFLFLLLLFF